jgi:hypothetical protein
MARLLPHFMPAGPGDDSGTIVDDVGYLPFQVEDCLFFRHERDLNDGRDGSLFGNFVSSFPSPTIAIGLHVKSLELLPSRA